ncbi:MAG: BamA/TamA family outer membrane protein [Thermoanaerobaculia bacterium]|nr:BamA/TamA family outer membrane protein [Thermoanaerobaculia bacterium]
MQLVKDLRSRLCPKARSLDPPRSGEACSIAPQAAGMPTSASSATSLIVTALLGLAILAAPLHAEEPLRVGTVTVITDDVYTAEEAGRGTAYAIVNTLHVRTQESVVRRFLLFREGDVFVASRLAESERNLRALGFIQNAKVTAGEPHDGVVDVTVVTQDSWSTEPGGSIGSAGGGTDASLSIREANLLGLGKELTVEYASDPDRSGFGIHYEDPAAFGRYWRGELAYVESSDGSQARVLVQRPFFSFSTPWSFRALVDDETLESRIYENGRMASEFSEARQALSIGVGRALRANDARAHRLTVGLELDSHEFQPLAEGFTTTLPADREFRYLIAEYEYAQNQFRKLNFVDRDMRYEDFRVGTQLNLRAGISPSAFGVDRTSGILGASVSRGFTVTPDSLLLGRLSWESRLGAVNRSEVLGLDLRYIRRTDSVHPHALIGRISARSGSELDEEKQFFADGDTGLRGYRLHAFAGDSSLLINLEERIFLGRELWQVVSPGLAVFVDAGNAANGSEAFDPGKLHFDAGVGLRIGASRSPRSIFRLDFAYAFDPDPLARDGWLVSFSGSQAF